MHSALKEVHCSNAGEMLEEKETDVNVMNFVETEYKSDEQEDMANQIDPRRRSLRRQKLISSVGSQPDDKFNSSHSSRTTKKYCKKRRKKDITDSKLVENCVENQRGLYPYAKMLKGICEELGKFHPPEPVTSEKIFKKLLPANINYPYASLLQELHQTCEYRQSDVFSVCDYQHQAEVSQIMKSINQRIPVPLEEEINSEQIDNDFESPFSGALLGMILKEKIQSYPSEDRKSTKSLGQILSNCMNEFYEDNPLQEMQSSSLLLKLSLLAENKSQANQNDVRTPETAASWAESDQQDMVDWKPHNRKVGSKIQTVGDGSLKRASLRKKKGIMKFDASPATNNSRRSKSKLSSISNQEPQLLLQLILGRSVNHSEVQGTGKGTCKKLETRSNVLKKIRSKIKDRMKDVESKPQANNHQKKCKKALSKPTEEECHKTENLTLEATEQQSLLKEYLLKPAGQENLLKSESDIPKLSTNSFLFSRLLQNFKSLSENSLSEDSLNKMGESSGSNILREMLLQSCSKHAAEPNNDSDNEQIDEKPVQLLENVYAPSFQSSTDDFVDSKDPQGDRNCEEKMENNTVSCRNILREILTGSQCSIESHYSNNSEESQDTKNITLREHLQLPSSEKDSSENDSMDPGSPVCEIKCEVKCDDEFLEDIFECPICHLEFSSEVDLSDHQMLFHCDEVQAASPACIIPHATDNVQNSLFLEKLPA